MIYVIVTEDRTCPTEYCLRIHAGTRVVSMYVVAYIETREAAENYCKLGGYCSGTNKPKYSFFTLNKIGEKNVG